MTTFFSSSRIVLPPASTSPIRDPARAADFKNTRQIGLATNRYFHTIAGSERIDIPNRLVPIGVIRFRCTGRLKKDDGDHNVKSHVVPPVASIR